MKSAEVKLLVPLHLYHLHTAVCLCDLSKGKWGERQRVYPVLTEYACLSHKERVNEMIAK